MSKPGRESIPSDCEGDQARSPAGGRAPDDGVGEVGGVGPARTAVTSPKDPVMGDADARAGASVAVVADSADEGVIGPISGPRPPSADVGATPEGAATVDPTTSATARPDLPGFPMVDEEEERAAKAARAERAKRRRQAILSRKRNDLGR